MNVRRRKVRSNPTDESTPFIRDSSARSSVELWKHVASSFVSHAGAGAGAEAGARVSVHPRARTSAHSYVRTRDRFEFRTMPRVPSRDRPSSRQVTNAQLRPQERSVMYAVISIPGALASFSLRRPRASPYEIPISYMTSAHHPLDRTDRRRCDTRS